MMIPLRRLVPIAAVATATVWFGITYGPVRTVRADIYMKLASVYGENPEAAGRQGGVREGVTLMNSGKLHYRVYRSSASVHEVLDDFQRALAPKEFHLFSSAAFPVLSKSGPLASQLPFLENIMSRSRFMRDESGNWGYASFLDLGPEANRDWHIQFKKKMEVFLKTMRLGDLGAARSIVAVGNPAGKSTTVMSYWTDADFNLKNFDDRTAGDLPGADVEGLPRITPLRRLLTFDHVGDPLGFLLVMYETPLPPEAAVEGFRQSATGSGWTTRVAPDPRRKSAPVLFLNRGSAEVQIFAHREGGRSLIMVSRRSLNREKAE
jgi:hypothetical protein